MVDRSDGKSDGKRDGERDGKLSGERSDSGELSPLQRYLAKQRQGLSEDGDVPSVQGTDSAEEDRGVAAGAPAYPQSDSRRKDKAGGTSRGEIQDDTSDLGGSDGTGQTLPPPNIESGVDLAKQNPSAGFWVRAAAYLIDMMAVWALAKPVYFVIGSLFWFMPNPLYEFYQRASEFFAEWAVMFIYYGWFYTEKGASPGKMIMGLEVSDMRGERLTYVRAFFRESIGKLISFVVCGIGFLIVAFRQDKRALHDLIFDTRVTITPRRAKAKNRLSL